MRRVFDERAGAAPEHHGVSGLQSERRDVDRDIRARFVDRADDTHRYALLRDAHAVGHRPAVLHRSHWVGQADDIADSAGDVQDPCFTQAQAIDQRLVDPTLARCLDVLGVRRQDVVDIVFQCPRDRFERFVLETRRCLGNTAGRLLRRRHDTRDPADHTRADVCRHCSPCSKTASVRTMSFRWMTSLR